MRVLSRQGVTWGWPRCVTPAPRYTLGQLDGERGTPLPVSGFTAKGASGRRAVVAGGGWGFSGGRMARLPRKGVTTRGARSALLRSECRGPRKVTP